MTLFAGWRDDVGDETMVSELLVQRCRGKAGMKGRGFERDIFVPA